MSQLSPTAVDPFKTLDRLWLIPGNGLSAPPRLGVIGEFRSRAYGFS